MFSLCHILTYRTLITVVMVLGFMIGLFERDYSSLHEAIEWIILFTFVFMVAQPAAYVIFSDIPECYHLLIVYFSS